MSEEESDKKMRFTIGLSWFWPSVAAMIIAMMYFGYSCHGCGDCRAPAPAKVAGR